MPETMSHLSTFHLKEENPERIKTQANKYVCLSTIHLDMKAINKTVSPEDK